MRAMRALSATLKHSSNLSEPTIIPPGQLGYNKGTFTIPAEVLTTWLGSAAAIITIVTFAWRLRARVGPGQKEEHEENHQETHQETIKIYNGRSNKDSPPPVLPIRDYRPLALLDAATLNSILLNTPQFELASAPEHLPPKPRRPPPPRPAPPNRIPRFGPCSSGGVMG